MVVVEAEEVEAEGVSMASTALLFGRGFWQQPVADGTATHTALRVEGVSGCRPITFATQSGMRNARLRVALVPHDGPSLAAVSLAGSLAAVSLAAVSLAAVITRLLLVASLLTSPCFHLL